jgi:hypothetical protein
MSFRDYIYLNRTLCDVLEEMRKCHETQNYSYLLGLIQEAQSYGNRMEGKLQDIKDLKNLRLRQKELVKEIEKLKKAKEELDD